MQDRALLWVETSAGGGHLQVASQLSRELQGLDVAVDLCTSSMDLGEQYDFGDANLLALEQIKGDDGGQL
ncbi:MAG: hypothetical protein KDD62_12815, partial [Bdellovibrionales bacterium]|nr:hypothetical protein [Bdellovibrionales bacterium]